MSTEKTVVQQIATALSAINRTPSQLGADKWEERLQSIGLPSGSGFDCGTHIVREKCKFDKSGQLVKLVLFTEFHHIDKNGYYDGWTQHYVTVTPQFDSIRIEVSGKDRNRIKDYIGETFYFALLEPHTWKD